MWGGAGWSATAKTCKTDVGGAGYAQGLEKYLMTKLHDRTFAMDSLDQERDQVLSTRLVALQFVKPEHLEMAHDFAGDAALVLAQKELKKINMFKVCDG